MTDEFVALESPGLVLDLLGRLYVSLDRVGTEWAGNAGKLRTLTKEIERHRALLRAALKDAPGEKQTVADLDAAVLLALRDQQPDLYERWQAADATVTACEAWFKVLDRQVSICQSAAKMLLADVDNRAGQTAGHGA